MTPIPTNQVTPKDIADWQTAKKELDAMKAVEMLLRKRIFGAFFPEPVEGSNNFVLPSGEKLNATHVIDRKIDKASLEIYSKKWVAEGHPLAQLGSQLVKWEPSLEIKPYRMLDEDTRTEFENVLTIKPGSPQMKILPAKA